MSAYLLDTNHLIALLNRIPVAVARQRSLEKAGDEVCSTTVSLGELYFGAHTVRGGNQMTLQAEPHSPGESSRGAAARPSR